MPVVLAVSNALFQFCQDFGGIFFICNIIIVFDIYSLICSSVVMHGPGTRALIGVLVHMLWSGH